ncbi:MAG: hypothetical protein ETSY1_23125 [Candidatus Entotheonella factor]|uniref:Hydrogenase maturation protease n=1 Tax=Entotheonella factor TaxID=1429438 RepID=W4LH83_ENTF1|nr:hydrogenase maturation protease [Candidatus Entotheonella palauensis]ETW97322.1 MAG: hypothetical protein ETSY1_23125 [Candidatus Entotheonella factor]
MAETQPRILITGVGNVLRQDDGFGIAVVHRLMERAHLPPTVRVLETGIAGIRLVQELMDGFDLLIVVDAVQRGGEPGQLYLLEAEVPDLNTYTFDDRNAFLADMHYTTPTRALTLAQALGVLPPEVYIMGCEVERDDFELGMSQAVAGAVPKAVAQIDALIAQYLGRGAVG